MEFDPAAHFIHVFSMALACTGMRCEDAVQWAMEVAQMQANAAGISVADACAEAAASVG